MDKKFANPAMFCIVMPANVPSIRVAEKCGFRHWYETIYEGEPTLVFRRPPGGKG
jgi:hypothetical protein